MTYKRLLAKSSKSPDDPKLPETLPGHLLATGGVANVILERCGGSCLGAFGLSEEAWRDRLRTAVLRGALLHDLGKANSHFQQMVRGKRTQPQALRHEYVGLWLLTTNPALHDWVFDGCDPLEAAAATYAIAGHHLQLETTTALEGHKSGDLSLDVYLDHVDVTTALDAAAAVLGLGPPPRLQEVSISLLGSPRLPGARRHLLEAGRWWERAVGPERLFVATVKALVIAADVVASAVPRAGMDAADWAARALARVCQAEELQHIADVRLGSLLPRPFQEQTAASESRVTFVRAGCGSGKTAAAYLWAARRAVGRKLFVCYPTTGTATEGFADYVPPDVADAALIHSRIAADLERMLANGRDFHDRQERALRYSSLLGWPHPVNVCTTDAVLGLVQNNRRPLFTFPAIANAAFVFDEIHQYDDRLFGALLRFLGALRGVPVLLMTASLQASRLAALEQLLASQEDRLMLIEGPTQLEALPRYVLIEASAAEAWRETATTLEQGGRVLWVANTVRRAMAIGREAERLGLYTLPYHSRYRYKDRVRRHGDVMEAFRAGGGVLAVTTQVCEVSLDLSADLLVSDLAPIPALIQRLGRLNRRVSEANPGVPKAALFLEPDGQLPYQGDDFDKARRWLQQLSARPVSQADLSKAFASLEDRRPLSRVDSAWLDGGPFSRPAPLREDGSSVSVVRQEDRGACVDSDGRIIQAALINYTIQMPIHEVAGEIRQWPLLGGSFVAPPGRIEYAERWGAEWSRNGKR